MPLDIKKYKNPLPSSAITKSELSPVLTILKKYSELCNESKINKLALRLAEEAFFGRKVLGQCTPKGGRNRPALPLAELAEFKKVIFTHCPTTWCNPYKFDEVWNAILENIGQLCKRIRANACM